MINMSEVNNSENSTYFLPKRTSNRKTLVLDLDETLVHSQFQPFDVPCDITLKIELEDELHDIHVMVRPGVKEFLENMGKIYEIVIFTASVSKYADPLLDIIDKEKYCKFRLFREHCTPINTCYVKEIKKLGRDLKDVVIVDNSPMSYALNPENGLPILTWFEDKDDRELYNISSILEFLSFVPDVRSYIRQFVVNDEISYNNVINVFDRYNEMLNQRKLNKNLNKNNNSNNNAIKNKSKDNKKPINKNNSKNKLNNSPLLSAENKENKENINTNNCYNIAKNNGNSRFKRKIDVGGVKPKNEGETADIKINININKKMRQSSKNSINSNKLKENKFNPKDIIASVENNENINQNILNNVVTDIPNVNQTTKNKTTKNINFNPNNIIASVPNSSMANLSLIPSTTTNKNSPSAQEILNGNIKLKNNKIIRHRKADSTNGLSFPKKIYENTQNTNLNKDKNFQHSNSIILNKNNKMINNLSNTNSNYNITNFTHNSQTTKNKNNRQIQLSMRISRDIGQELDKLEQSLEQDDKVNKKLSKSLTREKLSVSISSKNKTSNNYSNNTYCNKSSLIKNVKNNENANYIYHKKHKSINTSFIPFPSTTKNVDNNNKNNKQLEKKNTSENINVKNNKNMPAKFSKNSCTNKHRRFLSTSESYATNFLNNIYSSNTNHINHSGIIGSSLPTNNNNLNNSNNIFLNNLQFNKNNQRNSQRKKLEANTMKTERNKENFNSNNINYNNNINKEKKKENKIPFNLVKKRNSLNENAFKKKIPLSKNNMINANENKNVVHHKKNVNFNPENNGYMSVRPKSTKQVQHMKNANNVGNYNIGINKGTTNVNISIKKKEISVTKSLRQSN